MKVDHIDSAKVVAQQIIQYYKDEKEDVPTIIALQLAIVYALIGISGRLDKMLEEK